MNSATPSKAAFSSAPSAVTVISAPLFIPAERSFVIALALKELPL